MATPTPGTFPSFPPYQTGAQTYSGSEIGLLVNSASATSAATYYDSLFNMANKPTLTGPQATPTESDLLAFFQVSSNLPMVTPIGNLGVQAGNLPIGGSAGQILNKINGTNFNASWSGIVSFVSVGTGLATTGNATSLVIYGTGPLTTSTFTTNAVLIGAGTSLIGGIAATTAGFGLVSNGSAAAPSYQAQGLQSTLVTGVLGVVNGGIGTASLPADGVVLGNGSNALTVAAAATSGYLFTANGSASAPSFQAFNFSSALGTAVLAVPNGGIGTNALASHGIPTAQGTSPFSVILATTAGVPLVSQGSTTDPAYTTVIPNLSITTLTASIGNITTAIIGVLNGSTANISTANITTLNGGIGNFTTANIGTANASLANIATANITALANIAQAVFSGAIAVKVRVISSTSPTVTVNATTDYLIALAGATAFTVNLPINPATVGLTYLIKDMAGDASATNTITVAAQTGSIDNGTTYVITSAFGSIGVTYVIGTGAATQWSLN